MNEQALKELWLAEETIAHIHGWDFSHLDGRCEEQADLPWDYGRLIRQYLRPEHRLLDIDTGGGEFLLTLGHPYDRTAATEAYPPNVALCAQTLLPLGIDFREAGDCARLPYDDAAFDIVLDRHGSFDIPELHRILKPGGIFITQQVGEWNDRELVELLLPDCPRPFPGWSLQPVAQSFAAHGFCLRDSGEHFGSIRFRDVGALVWFARVLPWEFPDFSVERCFPRLLCAQQQLERTGSLAGRTHRFFLVAQKPF